MSVRRIRKQLWIPLGLGVLIIGLVVWLGYTQIIPTPFFNSNDQPSVSSDDAFADTPVKPTQDNKDEDAAREALDEGDSKQFVELYDAIIARHNDDPEASAYYYNQRAAELVVLDAALYKDQIIADVTKANELKQSPTGSLTLVELYSKLGNQAEADKWQRVANEQLKDVDQNDVE